MSHVCPMPRTTHPETKRGELGTKPVSLQARISLTFTSTKCWLDFQLLNAGIGTGVIVAFSLAFLLGRGRTNRIDVCIGHIMLSHTRDIHDPYAAIRHH